MSEAEVNSQPQRKDRASFKLGVVVVALGAAGMRDVDGEPGGAGHHMAYACGDQLRHSAECDAA